MTHLEMKDMLLYFHEPVYESIYHGASHESLTREKIQRYDDFR